MAGDRHRYTYAGPATARIIIDMLAPVVSGKDRSSRREDE